MNTICVLYYVLYECDLRDAKCGFWRSLHNDFEFAGGSFDWVGGQGLGRWSSRQVGEKLRSRRCAMRMRSTLKIHIAGDNTKGHWVKRLFPICPLSFLKESQRGAKGAFMANRARYMMKGSSCLQGTKQFPQPTCSFTFCVRLRICLARVSCCSFAIVGPRPRCSYWDQA